MYYKLLAWIIVLPALCFAQAPKLLFKHISIEEGLSNSTIETIYQDSRGFLWFGTRDGLNRYDGYQVIIYRNNAKDTNSLSDNYISCIYEDHQHTLWVGTINGLNAIDLAKNHFTRYKNQPGNPYSITNNQVTCIREDKKGRLWVGTFGGGLNQFDYAAKAFTNFRHSANTNSLSDDRVSAIFEDGSANLWVGTEKGLDFFRPQKKQFSFYQSPENSGIRNITQDKEGYLWLGTEEKGLLKFQLQAGSFASYKHQQKNSGSLGSNQVRCVLVDKKGNLWVGGVNGGLNLLQPKTNLFFNYQIEPNDATSLSQRTVSALFEDNQGNLWVGTHRGGINLYTPNTLKFSLFREQGDKNSLSFNDVRTFCEKDSNNIWIGTDGAGLNLFNRSTEIFTQFRHDPNDPGSIGSNEILHVMEDRNGDLWISTWGDGLNVRKAGSSPFVHFINDPSAPSSISSNYVQKTLEDHLGNFWIATYYGGLNLLDRKTNRFTRMVASPDGKSRLKGNNIVSMAEDHTGNLWFGTDDGGLNRYDPLTKTFDHYFDKDEKAPDLRVLFNDSRGRLWVGQAGLYFFDKTDNRFLLATSQGGLATEFIKGITEDADSNLWISTSNGLTRFNPDKNTFKKYNTSDGLQGLEFEANAYLETKDGQMYFGGVNGFNSFYPQQIRANPFIPPVHLTEFQVFNKKILPSPDGPLISDIGVAEEIRLDYRQSTISLGFAALNYTASENNQYAYKLEGLEDNWNYAGTDHKASYNNLTPGTYTFRVKGSNNDGLWNEEGSGIKIIISPPFWKSWWFTVLGALACTAVVIAFYQFRKRQSVIKMEAAKKEEMQQMQLQFFTNISHEFRTPLSLILGPLEKLQKENNQPGFVHPFQVMHRNVNRLLDLINELMDFRKAETGALKLKVMPCHLSFFLQEIEEVFSELALEKKIQFAVHLPQETGEVWVDRQVLEKIMINLVSNSFKYTADGGSVKIEVLPSLDEFTPSFANDLVIQSGYLARRSIYLKVSDSGRGISRESIRHLFERYYRITENHLGSGVGLAFVKSLAMLHKGNIYVYSEPGKGTEIIIGLPVDKNDYSQAESWISGPMPDTRLETSQNKYEYPANVEGRINLPEDAAAAQQKQCILIVEDNAELKSFLKASLRPYYQVLEARDGMDGLQKAKEFLPDLIISDVMMPVMDGIEFCKRQKDDINISHIPFMMLTAKDALEARVEGTGSGADFYFAKPLSMDLLLLTIRNIFEQKRKLKEYYKKDRHAEARELVHTAKDQEFMHDLLAIIDSNLTDTELDVELICSSIGMSRTKLYQKIKSLTGHSINDFVRTIRLRKAVEIMTQEDVSFAEVMFRIGIQTQSYFTKAFKKEFGKTPTQYLQELKK